MSVSRSKLILVLLGCVLVGWLTWSLLLAPRQQTEAAAGSDDAASKAVGPAPIPTDAERPAQPIATERYRETEPVADAPTSQPIPQGRKLRVLAPDDLPAPGTIVEFSLDPGRVNLLSKDAEAPESRQLAELVADSNGIVQLPIYKGTAVVRGRSGNLRGRTTVSGGRPGDATLRLTMPLAVIVVDERGAPQTGVPVAVVRKFQSSARRIDRETTGDDGMALLTTPPSRNSTREGNLGTTFYVALAIPLIDGVEHRFDPDDVQSSPIKLVLPPTARVTVRLVRADGTPFLAPVVVTIRRQDERLRWFETDDQEDVLQASTSSGSLLFPHVGLSGALSVGAAPADPSLSASGAVIASPQAASGETTVTLSCGQLATLVTGRLVTRSGEPLAKAQFDGWLCQPFQDVQSANDRPDRWLVTGADGRFKLRFEADPTSLTATELQLNVVPESRSESPVLARLKLDRPQQLKLPLPKGIRTGTADLGDVVVPDLEFVAAGRVVSTDRTPVAAAGLEIVRRQPGHKWQWAWELNDIRATSGSDGRFELRGKPAGAGLGLIAKRSGWVCIESTPFEVGARDVDVVLTKAGGLAGSIKGLGAIRWGAPIAVFVRGPGIEASVRRTHWSGSVGLELSLNNGRFMTRELLAGTYSVHVVAGRSHEDLLVLGNLVVVAGEVNRDPRLQNIDVDQFMRTRVITVLDDRGQPLHGACVAAVAIRERSRHFASFETGADGRALVATSEASVEIIVAMKGYASATLATVTDDVTVTLKKTTPRTVTIRLADSVQLPDAPLFIGADLGWLCGVGEHRPPAMSWSDPRNRGLEGSRFGRDRTVTLTANEAGVYEVKLWLIEDLVLIGGNSLLEQKGENAIVIVGEGGASPVTVDVEPYVLKRSIEEMKKE